MACNIDGGWGLLSAPTQRNWRAALSVPFLAQYVACANNGDSSKIGKAAYNNISSWSSETVPTGANDPSEFVCMACSDDTVICGATNGNDHRTIRQTSGSPTTWVTDTSGSTGNAWQSATWDRANGRFILVSANNSNRCINSADEGDTYTHRAIQAEAWKGVDSSQSGTTIACGDAGAISRSTDGGDTWTAITGASNPNTNNHKCVKYIQFLDIWVIASTSGTGDRVIISVDDGLNWTAVSGAPDRNWQFIAEGNNFVIIVCGQNTPPGSENEIIITSDLVTLDVGTTAADQDWTGSTFGGTPANFLTVGTASGLGPGILTQFESAECSTDTLMGQAML